MFIAFIMKAMGDIDWMESFHTEAEADEFGKKRSGYSPLDPVMDDPDHYEKYDPPVVLIFEIDHPEGFQNGKYKRPVAIFHRGEKFSCISPVT
jgi:hypothetical protein